MAVVRLGEQNLHCTVNKYTGHVVCFSCLRDLDNTPLRLGDSNYRYCAYCPVRPATGVARPQVRRHKREVLSTQLQNIGTQPRRNACEDRPRVQQEQPSQNRFEQPPWCPFLPFPSVSQTRCPDYHTETTDEYYIYIYLYTRESNELHMDRTSSALVSHGES
jgi:hypothetical protein